jgi:hypothetical protein
MEVKVDKEGHLKIMTRGKLRDRVCPFKDDDWLCGDWCPLFEQCDDPPRVYLNCAPSRLVYKIDNNE